MSQQGHISHYYQTAKCNFMKLLH